MNVSFQLERLKNVTMNFIKSQQSEALNSGSARRKRTSFGAKGKRASAS